jgi:4-hydroxy-tetrahydrodipicolinate synthase
MSHPAAPFGRMLTAMATPFAPDGSLDLAAAAALATHLADHGHDGVVISGTTGESPTTSIAEDGDLLRAVVEAVGDRMSVVAGIGTNTTEHSVELAQQAAKLGASGTLLVTPYYNKPSPAGVLAHFRTVVEAGGLPTMLYDVPGRTGTTIARSVFESLADHDLVVAVKDATGDFPRAARLTALGYAVYSGDDANTLGYLAHGGCGLVSVVGHVAGTELAGMIAAFLDGDHAGALATYQRLVPAFDAVMGVPNYGATTAKAALQLAGVLDNRRVRLPLVELDEAEVEALRVGLTAAGLLAA